MDELRGQRVYMERERAALSIYINDLLTDDQSEDRRPRCLNRRVKASRSSLYIEVLRLRILIRPIRS